MVDVTILKHHRFFLSFSDEQMGVLAERLEPANAEAGAAIFREAQAGDDALYIIISGSVKITKKGKTGESVLALLKDGEFFGEMSMIFPAPRSAGAVAIANCSMLKLRGNDYKLIKSEKPDIAVRLNEIFLKVLIQRLRDADEKLAEGGGGIGAL